MVKPVQITKYEAFDGTLHESAAAATAHEEANFESILVGLTIEEVRAAITRQPDSLARSEAMEKAGNLVARARREAGELKRRPVHKDEAPPAGQTATEPAPPEPEATETDPENPAVDEMAA